jgi:protein O-GlcNAc transferase
MASDHRPLSFDAVLGDADIFNQRGTALRALNRRVEALDAYDLALRINPDHVEALQNRGLVLTQLGRHAEALETYDRALSCDPWDIRTQINRARSLEGIGQYREAIAVYEYFRGPGPGRLSCLDDLARCLLNTCDWNRLSSVADEFLKASIDSTTLIDPYTLLSLGSTPRRQLVAAKKWLRAQGVKERSRDWDLDDFPADKLRVAYVSADFQPSPVSYLMAELFEVHDRDHLEVIGVSLGPPNSSTMRRRLTKSFDQFFDVSQMPDDDAAMLLRRLRIHLAVDLMGHTSNSRIGIFAQRAAPIQINYLSFPGTTGAEFIDYTIADNVVAPFGEHRWYSEKIAYVPCSYVVNDSKRQISTRIFSRSDEMLPDDAFVFCCFNGTRKLNRRFFFVWMRLLERIQSSVLWLYYSNPIAVENLKNEARACGIDPRRLVFAMPRPEYPEHLSRTKLADLFLDTLPFNACTTASDALWAGLPVLTCEGDSFIGRTGSSLLRAVGLPELVTRDLTEYEAKAYELAANPALLGSVRDRLHQNRYRYPLFNARRFARHIEDAYFTMVEIWRSGDSARSFSVLPSA